MLTPDERVLRSRAAAYKSWANTSDPAARTAPARAALEARWVDQVDPDRRLPEAERARRAEAAKKAFFTDLAFRSAVARRKRREARPNLHTIGHGAVQAGSA